MGLLLVKTCSWGMRTPTLGKTTQSISLELTHFVKYVTVKLCVLHIFFSNYTDNRENNIVPAAMLSTCPLSEQDTGLLVSEKIQQHKQEQTWVGKNRQFQMICFTLEQGIVVILPFELAAVLLGGGQPQHIQTPAVQSHGIPPRVIACRSLNGTFFFSGSLLLLLVMKTRRLGYSEWLEAIFSFSQIVKNVNISFRFLNDYNKDVRLLWVKYFAKIHT